MFSVAAQLKVLARTSLEVGARAQPRVEGVIINNGAEEET